MSALTMADVPLKYRQSEDEATLREAVLLVPLVEQAARSWIVEWLRDGLESAGDPVELKSAWARVVRYGHSVPTGQLREVRDLRQAQFDRIAAEHAQRQVA